MMIMEYKSINVKLYEERGHNKFNELWHLPILRKIPILLLRAAGMAQQYRFVGNACAATANGH